MAAAPPTRHVGGGGGFVDENQPLRIKQRLTGSPVAPRRGHVRPILLGGAHGFFETDAVTVEEPPDRSDPRPHRTGAKTAADFRERQVGLRGNERQQIIGVTIQWRAAFPAIRDMGIPNNHPSIPRQRKPLLV
jgi:hypothetical protein